MNIKINRGKWDLYNSYSIPADTGTFNLKGKLDLLEYVKINLIIRCNAKISRKLVSHNDTLRSLSLFFSFFFKYNIHSGLKDCLRPFWG